jgi:hypothetical protein
MSASTMDLEIAAHVPAAGRKSAGSLTEALRAFAHESGDTSSRTAGVAPESMATTDPGEYAAGHLSSLPLMPRGEASSRRWALVAIGCVSAAVLSYFLWNSFARADPAARAVATGTATIHSRPEGLQVMIDDEVRGTTPLQVTLPLGTHSLRIQTGTDARVIPLVIEAGTSVSHHIDLATTATSTKTGGLEVASDPPGANVRLDGLPAGKTPLTLRDVPVGEHVIVVGTGDAALTRRVNVVAGTSASVVASFGKPPARDGWVLFEAPFEMQIYEGGRLIGTSVDKVPLPAGVHHLELVNSSLGFRTSTSVQVVAGATANTMVTTPTGLLSVNALPWADVVIDGQPAGTTPLANITLPIGSHQIVLTHPRFGERRETVVVVAGTPARVGVDFGQ